LVAVLEDVVHVHPPGGIRLQLPFAAVVEAAAIVTFRGTDAVGRRG
jgi:hypothetical protein